MNKGVKGGRGAFGDRGECSENMGKSSTTGMSQEGRGRVRGQRGRGSGERGRDLKTWAQNKARPLGYVIITKRTKANTSGFKNEIDLKCDVSGEYKEKESSKDTATRKTNCPFMLVGKYSWVYNGWTLSVICDEHNHPPAQHVEAHPYARRLTTHEYRLVEDLTRKNNLMSLLHFNGYVHDYETHPVTNELEAVFFVHPKSFKIWRAFLHVLFIDATYKTNIYKMPFVKIVGVTSTRKTFCIAFAFISEEKEKNYKWVLERLKLTLEGCMHPRVVITDRELALINAYEKVFLKATRLLCRWHIHQNIIKHCRKMIKQQCVWDSFYSTWKLLEDSLTWISYMENYKQLHLVLRKYPRALSYLDEKWLNNHKEKFVSAWVDQSLNFEALDLILKELFRLDDPEFDYSMCGCRLRNSCGLPCACVLLLYLNSGEYIPLDSIDIFWRTLNVSWSDPVENEDILCDDVLHLFKEKFNEQSNVVKKTS
nr:hypothetical protein [Tanacetum cinerariifolium]